MSAFINAKLVPVKSNVGKSTLHKKYLKTTAVPQTVFTDSSGTKIELIMGYLPPEEFLSQVKSILKGYVD